MLTSAQYRSIASETQGLYKDRGSKFIAYLAPVESDRDISNVLAQIASEHPKARHVCYAYRLGQKGEPYRINDDGEPSGSAGRPIYNALLSAEISDVLCAVVRYFGGTKLGVPGLIKAYKSATEEAIHLSQNLIKTITRSVHITYPIEDMGQLYQLIKTLGCEPTESVYEPQPRLTIEIPVDRIKSIKAEILAGYHGYGVEDITDDFESDRIKVDLDASGQ